jgi:quinoprotein glucose dehydrogenase
MCPFPVFQEPKREIILFKLMSGKPLCYALAAALLALSGSTSPAAKLTVPKANMPRIAPASDEGERAIRTFQVQPGFEVELFAAEPLLAHPVAFGVDEKNRI